MLVCALVAGGKKMVFEYSMEELQKMTLPELASLLRSLNEQILSGPGTEQNATKILIVAMQKQGKDPAQILKAHGYFEIAKKNGWL